MPFLAVIAGLAPLIVIALLFWHDVPFAERVALAGIYLLVDIVATASICVLLRLDALLTRVIRGYTP